MSQAVERALEALWILNGTGRITVTELAEQLEIHKSTASRILCALERYHLIDRDTESAHYLMGQGILQLAGSVQVQRGFTQSAQALSDAIARELGYTANVAVLDGGDAVNIVQSEASGRLMQPRHYVGRRTPGHATSSGKVLLAYAGDEVVQEVLSGGLEQCTPKTITTKRDFLADLQLVRDRGWSSSCTEWEETMNAIGVPVHGARGDVVAAATITAHQADLPRGKFPEYGQQLAAVVARFGALLD